MRNLLHPYLYSFVHNVIFSLGFFYIFIILFEQFDCDMPWYRSLHDILWVTLGSVGLYSFHQFWKNFSHSFFLSPPLVGGFVYTCIRLLEVVQCFTDDLFFYLKISFWIVYIAMSLTSLIFTSARSNMLLIPPTVFLHQTL